jgi:hypothetical protein
MQLDLFATEKRDHGFCWRMGGYDCRNFHGYFQQREIGATDWQFVIYAFGDTDAVVYAINDDCDLIHTRVPIDSNDRLTICGAKYGRQNWAH